MTNLWQVIRGGKSSPKTAVRHGAGVPGPTLKSRTYQEAQLRFELAQEAFEKKINDATRAEYEAARQECSMFRIAVERAARAERPMHLLRDH
jgi:hypothetical protein